MFKKSFKFFAKHKVIAGIIIVLIAAGGGYFGYKSFNNGQAEKTRYVLTAVKKGLITTSVAGTGQVAASSQVEINPEVSGKITRVSAAKGQTVAAGALIVQLDTTEALKSIREAETSLESAQLALEKLYEPADELSILQAENNLVKARESKPEAEADLEKAYEDGFNSVADAFLNLADVMTGVYDLLYDDDFEAGQSNMDYYKNSVEKYDYKIADFATQAKTNFSKAKEKYNASLDEYKNASRYSDRETINKLVTDTYDATKDIAEAVKNVKVFIDYYEAVATKYGVSISALVSTHQGSLESYTSITSSQLTSLASKRDAIVSAQKAITEAERSIEEKTATLNNLRAEPDEFDVRDKKISLDQKKNDLQEAREQLADYSVRAPFAGVIAEIDAQKGETVTSGSVVATIITPQQIAEISLNEIDAAKIAVGQKANLEFDAIEGLAITGEVIDIDILGTVSQGVVSYNVKIGFDVQDDRIKSGMSLSATITLESKRDILMLPIGAVKTASNGSNYVQVLVDGQPQNQTVTTGLSSDTMIEITEGLVEGDEVVTQTVSGNSEKSASTNSNKSSNNNTMRSMMQLNGVSGGPPSGGR